ncbi:MAG: hypothetical protein HYV36_08935, partial [Lentisphaerae bacterium]|nr:hypothetical protein [Lentisphaerota bacterium]
MKTGIQQFGHELFYALPLGLMLLLALTPGISFTEDLGRHLLLGKIILELKHVPATNFLTYTYPDFPFINHHWLSEVVLYCAYRAVGLNGLIALKALLMCATLALALRAASLRRASPLIAFAATLSAVALGYRAHIRPELFTYLGVALYGWLIARAEYAPERKIPGWGCFVFLAYGWFWANAHIYFIFGIGMLGAYVLACWWRIFRQRRMLLCEVSLRYEARVHEGALPRVARPRQETILLLALIAVSLLNPNGWRGLLYPLGIFGNYCLAITENASPLSYWETVLNPMLATLPLLSLVALWVLWRTFFLVGRGSLSRHVFGRTRLCGPTFLSAGRLAECLILLVALFAAWGMLRSAPLLALTLLPALGLCLGTAPSKVAPKGQNNSSFGHISLWTHFIKCVHVFLKD